jgi:phosphate acetyltransferase
VSFRDDLRRRAGARRRSVVLAEGWDERVRQAAGMLEREGVAEPVVLERSLARDPRLDRVAQLLAERRPDKVGGRARARQLAADPLYFAAGLVALGEADAAVAGAVHPTADVLRAAFWAIGRAPGITTVSSAFYMAFDSAPGHALFQLARRPCGEKASVLTFADCGVVPDPDATQLAEIAVAAARDHMLVVDEDPVVAFLSYSTSGSADGPKVNKVRQAAERFGRLAPDIQCDGELQGDAAIVPAVAEQKAPDSAVGGCANVLIFPDLDSGNIAYKLVQRLAGATATGPVLQGLARPMMDLSRGATVDDVVDVAAVAVLQAGESTGLPTEEEE